MNLYAPTLTDADFAALPLTERFVLVAAYFCDKIKVHEEPRGSNRGPILDQWADELGYPRGLAWCGVFATICLRRAGYHGPLPPNPAGTHSWADWARAEGHAVATPRRGDLFVSLLTPTTGHMGIVLDPTSTPGTYRTVSGNTNADGGREGYEVLRQERVLTPDPRRVYVRLPGAG